jgi:hypothetical protein
MSVSAAEIRAIYRDYNGTEAASEENLRPEVVAAVEEYLKLNSYDESDDNVDEVIMGAIDVLRLAYDGHFRGLGPV